MKFSDIADSKTTMLERADDDTKDTLEKVLVIEKGKRPYELITLEGKRVENFWVPSEAEMKSTQWILK